MGATDTIATIFGVGILGYFMYKVILPKLQDTTNSNFQLPDFNFPSPQQQQPMIPTAAAAAPKPTPTTTKQPTKPKQPILTPTTSEMTSPNVAGTAFTFNVVGDLDDNALAAATATNLCGSNPTVVLIIGDFAYHCNAQKWWTGSMKSCNGKNVLGSVGNHDCSGKGFLELFTANGGKWEFTKKVGNIAFIAVNTGYCSATCMNPSTSEPLFRQAQADPSIKFIVAHFHKPIFTTGTAPDAPMSLHNMMKKYPKVKMAFAGHNHSYRRYAPQDGIQYITAGAGGHDKSSSTAVTKGPSSGSVGVVKCRVSTDGAITCQYVANSGEILDQWGLTAQGKHTGTGGVTPKGGTAPGESGYAQAFYTHHNQQLNPPPLPPADKEERDNAFLSMMDRRNIILHPQRKFNNRIYHYSNMVL